MSSRSGDDPRSATAPKRRKSKTLRIDIQPDAAERPKDCCTLTMLTGPTPGTVKTLTSGELVIGRDDELPWPIEDRGVSSRHARIVYQSGGFEISDLDSTNGTYVNGRRVLHGHRLHDGDRIQLGEQTLIRVALHDETEQQAARRIYEAAVNDPLTGVFNRGHLEASLNVEFAYAIRHRTPLSLLFIDLDHFTAVNNTWGHQAGDAVLHAVAQAVKDAVRTEDLVARYGGEEFVLLARGIDLNGALVMAERVRRIVEQLQVAFEGQLITITTSIGVACLEAATPFGEVRELVAAADRALYRAKHEGRNRIVAALDATPTEPGAALEP